MTAIGTYILCGGGDDGSGRHRLPKGVTDSKSVQGWYDLAAADHALGFRMSFWRAPGGLYQRNPNDWVVAGWELLDADSDLSVLKSRYVTAWSALAAMGHEVIVHRQFPNAAGTDAAQLAPEIAAFTSVSYDEVGAWAPTDSLRYRLTRHKSLVRRVGVEPLHELSARPLLRCVEFVHVDVSDSEHPRSGGGRLALVYEWDDFYLTYKDLAAQGVALSIGIVDNDPERRWRCTLNAMDFASKRPLVEVVPMTAGWSEARKRELVQLADSGAAIN